MLLACGSNGRGQLGLGHTEDVDKWTEIPLDLEDEENVDIAGGGNHTCIVNAGRAWFAGSGNCSFYEIERPQGLDWLKCSAGWDFTVLIDSDSGVWVAAAGSMEPPKQIAGLKDVTRVESGMMHTIVGTADGTLWGWGAARKGQLGDFHGIKQVTELTKLPVSSHYFSCGRDFTILGSGAVLGRPWTIPQSHQIRCGWSFAAYGNKTWHFIGNNSHGQTEPPHHDYETIALGSEHGLGALADGTVETWGWGEHGNCPSPLKIHKNKFKTIKLFGGCATSFIYLAT